MKASDLHMLASPFAKEEVHWRAQTVTRDGKKALALAYLDARNVMDRLDEVCGIGGWQSEHYDCGGGRMGCKIGIVVGEMEPVWVWKSDGAGGTDVEADKGAFSDALKRAAVSWGIGRYLYSLGNTYVPCEARDNGQKDKWGNIKWQFVKFLDDPWKHVKESKQTMRGPLSKTDLKNAMKALSAAMNSQGLASTGDLERVEDEYREVIAQAKVDAPDWWRGYHGKHNELISLLPVGAPTGNAGADPDDRSTYED